MTFPISRAVFCMIAGLAPAAGVHAQLGAPEGWPCVQRHMPSVSVGTVWPGELPAAEGLNGDADIAELADALAARSLPLERAYEKIEVFAVVRGDPATLKSLLVALHGAINLKRNRVMDGIMKFSKRQQMIVERIQTQAKKIESLKDSGGDAEDLETRQKWDIRAFDERENLAAHLCEQPVLLEQRFFAIGRAIVARLDRELQ